MKASGHSQHEHHHRQRAADDATLTPASIDALWMKRDDPAVMKQIQNMTFNYLKAHPEDPEALWRHARTKQWLADTSETSDAQKALGKEAMQISQRAVAKAPTAVAPLRTRRRLTGLRIIWASVRKRM